MTPKPKMDWTIWTSKAWKGALTAGVVGAIGVLMSQVQSLQTDSGVPSWVVLAAPLVLYGLNLLNNLAQHTILRR